MAPVEGPDSSATGARSDGQPPGADRRVCRRLRAADHDDVARV